MKRALADYRVKYIFFMQVVGLPNNLKFLKRGIDQPIFQKGEYDTSYIPENIDKLLKKGKAGDSFSLVCAIVARNNNLSKLSPLPS